MNRWTDDADDDWEVEVSDRDVYRPFVGGLVGRTETTDPVAHPAAPAAEQLRPGAQEYLDESVAPVTAAYTLDPDDEDVRGYLLTGGRTGGGLADIAIETIVVIEHLVATAEVRASLPPEQRAILDAVTRPVAAAEISAHTRIALGVVQVLVGDLVHDGLLTRSQKTTSLHDDISFIERLIHGVRAL